MKQYLSVVLILILITGCQTMQESGPAISGIQDLMLNEQDLQELGLTANPGGLPNWTEYYPQGTDFFALTNGTHCELKESLESSDYTNYRNCAYRSSNTSFSIIVKRYSSGEDLNFSYGYDSTHYQGAAGIISVNEYGDRSLLRVNDPGDFTYQFVPFDPNIFHYNFYISKDLYLIRVYSEGEDKDAVESVKKIGEKIISKFGNY